MILCIFLFLFAVMKSHVLFFSHQAFSFPLLSLSSFFSTSARVWGNAQKCFLFQTLTLVIQLCFKEMGKSTLSSWLNRFPFERENLCFFYLQTICQYFYCVIQTVDLEGFFFSPINQLGPHCLVGLKFMFEVCYN